MSNFNGCGDPLDLNPDKCDGISLNCTRTDPNYNRYLDGKQLVEIVATKDGETYISFDIILRGSWFYNMDSYSLTEFDKMPNSELTIGSHCCPVKFRDVEDDLDNELTFLGKPLLRLWRIRVGLFASISFSAYGGSEDFRCDPSCIESLKSRPYPNTFR